MKKKPNILFIITDQQRTDTLGFLKRTPCQTPHIDRLASRGISFDQCITPDPICGPARAAIFSGRYPHQLRSEVCPEGLGVTGRDYGRDMMLNTYSIRETPDLTNLLKGEGYSTAYAGKWHVGEEIIGDWFERVEGNRLKKYSEWLKENNLPDGWAMNDDDVKTHRFPHMSIPFPKVSPLEASQTVDAWIADIAIRQIEERPKDQSFFQVCSFIGPHPPFKIPEPYFSLYDPESIPEPPNFKPSDLEPACKYYSFYRHIWQDYSEDWSEWKKSVAVYWGFVKMMDNQVGRLIDCLERDQLLDETLIIFCSDHGEMLGQHGLWQKMQPYEESLRVPLVMAVPGMKEGEGIRSQAGASLIDIAPTILSVAGVKAPENYEGIDLSPSFTDGTTLKEDRMLFSEQKPLGHFHGEVDWRLATDNRYKYVWNHTDRDEFYDLSADPWETENLINNSDLNSVISTYQDALFNWLKDTADPLLSDFEYELSLHERSRDILPK